MLIATSCVSGRITVAISLDVNESRGSTPCRIGLWGTFDLPGFDALIPRVLRRELSERLPSAQIRASAPYGSLRPTPRDGGVLAEPLGAYSPQTAAGQSADLDCIIVAGAELLADTEALAARYGVDPDVVRALAPDRFFTDGPGPLSEDPCPMLWCGVTLGADPTPEEAERLRAAAAWRSYVSVTDDATRRRLAGAGIGCDVQVVPDVALLAPRLHSPELLAKRLDYLRLMGWYPRDGAPLLVEGDSGLIPHAPALATAIVALRQNHPDLQVVVAEMGSAGDRAFADALQHALPPGAAIRMPGCVSLEDLSASLAYCGVFAGSSPRGALLAFAYDRPLALLDLGEGPRLGHLRGLAELVGLAGCLVEAPEALNGVLERALAASFAPLVPAPAGRGPGTNLAADGRPHASRLTALTEQVDASLDAVAEMAEMATRQRARSAPATGATLLWDLEERLRNLQVAHDARSRRLATERMVFANHLRKAEAEIARLRTENARLHSEAADREGTEAARAEAMAKSARAAEAELRSLRATRTFRYTAELREVYSRVYGRRHQPPPDAPTQP